MSKSNWVSIKEVNKSLRLLGIAPNQNTRKYSHFLRMILYVVREFNRKFHELDMPVKLNCNNLLKQAWSDGLQFVDPVIMYCKEEEATGEIYEQQIDGASKILANMYRGMETGDSSKLFNHVPAPTQWGKSGMLTSLLLAGPLFWLLYGQVYHLLYLLPPREGLEKQFMDAYDSFLHLMGRIEVEVKGKKVSLEAFHKRHSAGSIQRATTLLDFRKEKLGLNNPTSPESHEIIPFEKVYNEESLSATISDIIDLDNNPASRRQKNLIENIKSTLRSIVEGKENHNVLICIDEVHFGSGGYVTTDKGTGEKYINPSVMGQILLGVEEITQDRKRFPLVTTSATAWQLNNKSSVTMVVPLIPKSYRGPNFVHGLRLNSNPTNCPTIYSHRELGEIYGVPELEYVETSAFNDYMDGFKKFLKKTKWSMTLTQYRDFCVNTITSLIKEMNKRGEFTPDRRGIIIRLANKNTRADWLTGMLYKHLAVERIIPLPYYSSRRFKYGKHRGLIKMKAKEAVKNAGGRPYIVVVTGAGRMADDFPSHCYTALDFTRMASTQSSADQGLFGRMCGHNKPVSRVAFPEEYADYMKGYVNSRGEDMGLRPSQDSEIADKRPIRTIYINFQDREHMNHGVVARLKKSVQKYVIDISPGKKITGKRKPTDVWETALSEEVTRELETLHEALFCAEEFKIARPGLLDDRGRMASGKIAFRSAKFRDAGMKLVAEDQLHQQKDIRPSFAIDNSAGRKKSAVVGIRLWLSESVGNSKKGVVSSEHSELKRFN